MLIDNTHTQLNYYNYLFQIDNRPKFIESTLTQLNYCKCAETIFSKFIITIFFEIHMVLNITSHNFEESLQTLHISKLY